MSALWVGAETGQTSHFIVLIPFISVWQFFIDYNLYGMNYINVSASVKRKDVAEDLHTPGEVISQPGS